MDCVSHKEKAGAGQRLPCFPKPFPAALEVELQGELEFPCSLRTSDFAERRVGGHGSVRADRPRARIKRSVRGSTGKIPDRMVKSVEGLEPEFQLLRFREREALVQ